MAIWKLGGLAIAAVIGSGLLIGQASAMPANGMATVAGKVGDGTQEVRWVGGWRGSLGCVAASDGAASDGAAAVGAWAGAAAGLVDGAGIAASTLTADPAGDSAGVVRSMAPAIAATPAGGARFMPMPERVWATIVGAGVDRSSRLPQSPRALAWP